MQQSHFIIGTAGHIDHGKSSLVHALTGTDPDRLKEEKTRGITITLGFAQLMFDDGTSAGVVDVPGHEHFVRQMIAGATGVDVALLVVAADDGFMPQTMEHLAVLETLGVSQLVVALTKADLVDEEWLTYMQEEVHGRLQDTPYAQSRVVAVSSKTGVGLSEIKDALSEACKKAHHVHADLDFRLPVDRSFTIKGAGTVITGTLWSGVAHLGDTIEISSTGALCKIRDIQVHGQSVKEVGPGNRVALNLHGISLDEVRPGDFLIQPGMLTQTMAFDARLTYKDTMNTGKPFKNRQRVHIAHGTKEVSARIFFLEDISLLAPGEQTLVQVRLEEPLMVAHGDVFVMRSYSPPVVIGGGEVLVSHPRKKARLRTSEVEMFAGMGDGDFAYALVNMIANTRDGVAFSKDLAAELGMSERDIQEIADEALLNRQLVSFGVDKKGGGIYYALPSSLQKKVSQIERELLVFHQQDAQSRGMTKNDLRNRIGAHLHQDIFDIFLNEAQRRDMIAVSDGLISHATAGKAVEQATLHTAQKIYETIASHGLQTPTVSELAQMYNMNAASMLNALHVLEEKKAVEQVRKDWYVSTAALDACRQNITDHFAHDGLGTVAAIKDVMDVSRKYAVPLLEHFDATGFTVRRGDVRVLGHT